MGNKLTYMKYLISVKRRSRNFFQVPDEYKDDRLCMMAARRGIWLQHIPLHLRTERICLETVKRCGFCIPDVPEHLQYERMCVEAVKQNERVFEFLPQHMKPQIALMLNIPYNQVENNQVENKVDIPNILNHADEETKDEKSVCCVCMTNKKCVLFENCNHMSVCFSCSTKLNGKCPLCRVENQKTRVVFH